MTSAVAATAVLAFPPLLWSPSLLPLVLQRDVCCTPKFVLETAVRHERSSLGFHDLRGPGPEPVSVPPGTMRTDWPELDAA